MSATLPRTRFLTSYTDPALMPHDGKVQVAFFGRSNAGKSSLISGLAGEKGLARESATPGRTQLINVFAVSNIFEMVDLPGYGFAKAPKEQIEKLRTLLASYVQKAPLLKLAVVIVDSRLGPTETDRAFLEMLRRNRIAFLLIANKVDKLNKNELKQCLEEMRSEYPDAMVIAHSALTGEGRGVLIETIMRAVK